MSFFYRRFICFLINNRLNLGQAQDSWFHAVNLEITEYITQLEWEHLVEGMEWMWIILSSIAFVFSVLCVICA